MTMSNENVLSRRGLLMKMGVLFNGVVATALTVPIVRFVLSSITRGRANAYLSWVPLGSVSEFPEGETRMATFRNPYVTPTDGKTVDTACWVRRVAGDEFQVFAVNCAHLGCPVRWFPQSGLFMCPCHGGAYYRDGSRASGPPERGLFEYPHKIENGLVTIQAGELPTPGLSATLLGKKPRGRGARCAAKHSELVVCVRQRRSYGVPAAIGHRDFARAHLRSLGQ
jgi:Rieske Fe-S protein